jgi:hypothetical protein
MDDCNNLGKKRVSCCDAYLLEFISKNVDEVEELGDMQDGFCDKEINLELNFASNKHVECSIGAFGSNFDNDEGIKDKVAIGCDERENEEILT